MGWVLLVVFVILFIIGCIYGSAANIDTPFDSTLGDSLFCGMTFGSWAVTILFGLYSLFWAFAGTVPEAVYPSPLSLITGSSCYEDTVDSELEYVKHLHCGSCDLDFDLDSEFVFCPTCGEKLVEVSAEGDTAIGLICVDCGTAFCADSGFMHCPTCGDSLLAVTAGKIPVIEKDCTDDTAGTGTSEGNYTDGSISSQPVGPDSDGAKDVTNSEDLESSVGSDSSM